MFKVTQPMPELTGRKYDAFKKTMHAAEEKELKELAGIRRTISTLPSEGEKQSLKSMWKEYKKGDLKIPGVTPSKKGGRSRRRKSRKKRRKRKTKRRKSRKKRRKSRRKRRR